MVIQWEIGLELRSQWELRRFKRKPGKSLTSAYQDLGLRIVQFNLFISFERIPRISKHHNYSGC